MTLTVRLDTTLATALDRYCDEQGVTKSLVVQESLAIYLAQHGAARPLGAGRAPSANYLAFAAAGLVGGGELGGRSADKAAVRERAVQRLRRSTAR